MGCWNETCALTHTPITNGEECWMVVLKKDIFSQDYWQLEFPRYSWLGTFFGKYNDYGWLEEVPEEVDGHEYDDVARFFVSKEAADYAINRFRRQVEKSYQFTNAVEMEKLLARLSNSTPIDYVELHPNYIETQCFVYLAHSNRMNLFGATTSQMRSESFDCAKDLWEIAKRRYEALIVEEKKWNEEETNETPGSVPD
jgi:hypothetical protein